MTVCATHTCTTCLPACLQVSVPVNHHLVDSLVSEGAATGQSPPAGLSPAPLPPLRPPVTGSTPSTIPSAPSALMSVVATPKRQEMKPAAAPATVAGRGQLPTAGPAASHGTGGHAQVGDAGPKYEEQVQMPSGVDSMSPGIPPLHVPRTVVEAARELFGGVIDTDPCSPDDRAGWEKVRVHTMYASMPVYHYAACLAFFIRKHACVWLVASSQSSVDGLTRRGGMTRACPC